MSEVSFPPLPGLCFQTSSACTHITSSNNVPTLGLSVSCSVLSLLFPIPVNGTWGQSISSCCQFHSLVTHPLAPWFSSLSSSLPDFSHLPPIFFYTYPISHTSWKCCFLSFLGWLSRNCCRTQICWGIPLLLSPCLESKVWLPCTGMKAASTSNLTLTGSVPNA